ncbi:restriction endonuclease [Streptomyces sp. NBC_00683]|uniref:restriction endonuclease n=1 Tax=Streptomyces sp. NBC_00683 TaxID=2903670 RepID=UPI002E31C303|nr:restriction endonuclease [Streptomyces sp. NBC_00683]
MTVIDAQRLANLLASAQNLSNGTADRGRFYEDVLEYLFSNVPGCQAQRNSLNQFISEEVDLSISNFREPDGLKMLPEIFLVECKNWSAPVDSAAVAFFATKIRHRGCSLGVLVAANGVTGDPVQKTSAFHQASLSLFEGVKILLVTSDDISKIATTQDFVSLLHKRFLDLHCAGTFTLA